MLPWRTIQKQNFTSMKVLLKFLELEENHFILDSPFPLNLPRRLAEKIEKKNLNDPILRQFVPLKEEEIDDPLFSKDPLNEAKFQKSSKFLHKYEKRALFVTTSACAMNCRFCFRRHYPYEKEIKGFEKELTILRKETSLQEILLSGGDPLSLSDDTLKELFSELNKISHLKRIRFHTRFPIGIPERITEDFLTLLKNCSKQVLFILHCNHPRELDEDVISSLKKIQNLGIPILTQSVLLKGVNDSTAILQALFETFINAGFIPIYIYDLDPVANASHFKVPINTGKELLNSLLSQLPGYGIPRYAKEVPGHPSKKLISFF